MFRAPNRGRPARPSCRHSRGSSPAKTRKSGILCTWTTSSSPPISRRRQAAEADEQEAQIRADVGNRALAAVLLHAQFPDLDAVQDESRLAPLRSSSSGSGPETRATPASPPRDEPARRWRSSCTRSCRRSPSCSAGRLRPDAGVARWRSASPLRRENLPCSHSTLIGSRPSKRNSSSAAVRCSSRTEIRMTAAGISLSGADAATVTTPECASRVKRIDRRQRNQSTASPRRGKPHAIVLM